MAVSSSREDPVAGTRDVFLLLERREFGNRLYKPISSSLRIKYSCFAVSSQLIVLGANTGAVYVFVKDSLSYISFIPNKERDIQIARFSPDGKCLAIGTGCGVVIVWEFNVSHLQSSKKILEITEHRGSHISDMIWDNKGQQLFVGDTDGKVTVAHMPGVLPRTVLSSAGGIRLRKPGTILICETPVVQLDYDNDHLLVSCKHKSAVMNLKREEVISVGSQERDGIYGACFYRSMHASPQQTHLLSARPKARIWKASLDGKVELTYKLKDLMDGMGMTPIYGLSFKPETERSEQAALVIPNVFKRIRVINDHLVVWNANTLYIMNILSNTITQHSLSEDIQDLQVFERDVWISTGDPLRFRCLSLLHYDQLLKSLSQLQLHPQITQLSEMLNTETEVALSPVVEPHNTANDQDEGAPEPDVSERVPADTGSVSLTEQETEVTTAYVTQDRDYTALTPQQQASGEECSLIQNVPGVSDADLNETIVPSQSDNAPSVQHLPSAVESINLSLVVDNAVLTEPAVTSQQSSEIEAVYSGIASSAFNESRLPFPKVSRIRKTQSLREGDLPSSWSSKLVRKRSKKLNSGGSRTLSQNESESDTFVSFTRLDLFSTDIFQDTLVGSEREQLIHSLTLPELESSPISQHIPRSERKKKQKKRDSASQIPLSPSAEQTYSPDRTDRPEADFDQESVALAEHATDSANEHCFIEKVHSSKEPSRNNQIYEQFIHTSQQTWSELESYEDDFLSTSRSLSTWLTSFITLLTSVPASSLPGSYAISSLTSISRSSHYQLLQQLATAAMLAGCWLFLSFPNPLLPTATATSSDAYNFFYLQAIFLSLPDIRSYLAVQEIQVDRSRAYSLYIKGLEDFKGIVDDSSNTQVGAMPNIESRSFPSDIKGNILSEIGFCVNMFPCLLPWEIHTILFGKMNSPQLLKSHNHSQAFLEYMEELFLSAEAVPSHQILLNTVFSTDYKSFITWCCLSLSFLPSTTKLTVNNFDTPMPHSHQLDWRYKQVWELILNWRIMGPDLAMRCVPYFKQHCFWLALISVYFMLGHKEKAIPLLLHLNDISLIDQCSPVWGTYPDGISDWKLTIETFLKISVDQFGDLSRRDEARDRFYSLFSLAITELGCLSGIELLREIIPSLEISNSFPYELFLKLVKVAIIENEKSKIAFTLLERLDEELWKQKPSAVSLQFLSQDQLTPNESVRSSLTLETSSFQWGIRIKRNEFQCQSCHIDIISLLPILPSDIQVFACGHCYHKACLVEGACTLCFSKFSQ